MDIKVADCVGEILLHRDLVVIPEFGGFVGEPAGAEIDHVLGKVSPPSKKVTFNEHLVVNDGVLSTYLMETYSISKIQADQEIQLFVQEANLLLEQKEVVEFPKLGRLMKDFQGQFKFYQSNDNLNADAFGLEDVQASPIIRKTNSPGQSALSFPSESEEPVLKVGPVETTGFRTNTKKKRSENNILLAVILTAALFILFGIFLFKDELLNQQLPDYDSQVIEDPQDVQIEDLDDNDDYEGWDDEGDIIPEEEEEVVREKEIRQWKEAEIVVGVFGEKKNAEALIQRIIQRGYEAVALDRGKATAVAVRYAFETEAEFQTKFEQVKDQFNDKAWVYKKE